MNKVSLVIPMYYEEQVAEECYKRVSKVLKELKDYDYEIIFVNDGSKDKTLEILENIAIEDNNVKVISFSRNFGHQAAVTAGLKYVTGDAIVIMDADLQDPPELIPDMLKHWEDGYEVIYGKRKTREGCEKEDGEIFKKDAFFTEASKERGCGRGCSPDLCGGFEYKYGFCEKRRRDSCDRSAGASPYLPLL